MHAILIVLEPLERTWPIAIATGWGFGVAYADAQVIGVLVAVWYIPFPLSNPIPFHLQKLFHPHYVPGVTIEKQKPSVQ
jgi:MICOS complex subunit MIC10